MIRINGEERNTAGKTVAELLETDGYNPLKVAVELNENILPKTEYGSTELKDGDTVEIVRFVGGG
ncbi:MAG: sulfur carrier protein ThiS [Oscillospiraceae bacterium]|nr:sulfur carrier protein ThiS [Oscillospiraceae bacterium]